MIVHNVPRPAQKSDAWRFQLELYHSTSAVSAVKIENCLKRMLPNIPTISTLQAAADSYFHTAEY